MNTYVFGLLACLVVLTTAQERCCTPDQWETTLGMMQGNAPEGKPPSIVAGISVISYDYTNKKVAIDNTYNNMYKSKWIANFNKGKLYTIENGKCEITAITKTMQKQCIPAGASYLNTAYYGAGDNKLMVDGWTMQYEGLTVTTYMSQAGCLPVSQGLFGKYKPAENVALMRGGSFFNTTLGIIDENVFKPPASCTEKQWPFLMMPQGTGFMSLF